MKLLLFISKKLTKLHKYINIINVWYTYKLFTNN